MELNKYLRIKSANIGYFNAAYLSQKDPKKYSVYRRIVPITNTINTLADSSGFKLPNVGLWPEDPDVGNTATSSGSLWPDLKKELLDFNGLSPTGSSASNKLSTTEDQPYDYIIHSNEYIPSTILHELGHTIDIDKHNNFYNIVPHVPVLKRFNTLMHERGADAEARNFINKTIDTNPELRDRLLKEYNFLRDDPIIGSQRNYYRNNIPIIAGSVIGATGLGAGLGYAGYKGGDWLSKRFKLKNNGIGSKLLRYGGALSGGIAGVYAGDALGAHLGKKYVQTFNKDKTRNAILGQQKYYNDNYNEPGGWRDGSKPGSKLVQDLMDYADRKTDNKP